ncbi:predicted protein [Sclerotinia sclerotiorum 1980 UF-70]|uniref:Uncharacterized protein n=1 Tax=Sclerotinia sclerotiorum (strain ATCC 18683 / 1980 / Ss-1) TaxID=665079 RepID=A7EVL6_SCLS1|nr:predicted protein [Sclerotinia sclerotiorum 1980 UF-70]EDN93508.1 predicted protein [Sclerotinia sclerotiorum 1980 UF-70]
MSNSSEYQICQGSRYPLEIEFRYVIGWFFIADANAQMRPLPAPLAFIIFREEEY